MAQIFPKWSNKLGKIIPISIGVMTAFIVFVFWYWFSPKNLNVGYEPEQPVAFSHKQHASDLGIDCMFCHVNAEKSAYAGVPATSTCMICHMQQANKNSIKFSSVTRSFNDNIAIPWIRSHKVGDYVYFDHSAHVLAGVGCVSCHGRVDEMQVVRITKPLSMGWCLECHREPAKNLRPVREVTNMNYHQSDVYKKMAEEKALNLNPPVESCSGCHR